MATSNNLSTSAFAERRREFLDAEFPVLNNKTDLRAFMKNPSNGWTRKVTARIDHEVFVKKGTQVAIRFNPRHQKWEWRDYDKDSEQVANSAYQLARKSTELKYGNSKQLSPLELDTEARNLLRENVADKGIDIRKLFPQYMEVIDWMEKKGSSFPINTNTPAHKLNEPKIESFAVEENSSRVTIDNITVPKFNQPKFVQNAGVDNSRSSSEVKTVKDFLLAHVSLAAVATDLGFKPKEYSPKTRIPQEVIYDVHNRANNSKVNILKVAKAHFSNVEEVTPNLYQATNPLSKEKFASLLIDEAANTWSDKTMNLSGGAVDMLVTLKGMKFDEAVRSVAKISDIQIPETSVEATGKVYYKLEDSTISIHKNEETGRNYYYDHEKQEHGTALDLIKLVSQEQVKGNKLEPISEKEAIKILLNFALGEKGPQGERREFLLSLVDKERINVNEQAPALGKSTTPQRLEAKSDVELAISR